MCEFNVFLKKDGKEEKIAENIVKVLTYSDGVELKDPLGAPIFIKNSIIETNISFPTITSQINKAKIIIEPIIYVNPNIVNTNAFLFFILSNWNKKSYNSS